MSLSCSWAHLNSPILSVLEQLYLFIKQNWESRRSHLFLMLHCLQCLQHPMHKDRYAYKSRDNMQRITEELDKYLIFVCTGTWQDMTLAQWIYFLKSYALYSLEIQIKHRLCFQIEEGWAYLDFILLSSLQENKASNRVGVQFFWVGGQWCSETEDKLLCVWFLQILLHGNCKSQVLRKTCKG